jgi:hypothetical protein
MLVHIFRIYHVVAVTRAAGRRLVGDLADAVPDDAGLVRPGRSSIANSNASFGVLRKKFERLKKALDRVRGAALYTASRRAEAPRDTSKTVGNLEKRGSRASYGFTDL